MCASLMLGKFLLCSQEQERRRKAELAAHSAMNGQRVKAFEYAGPDFEVGTHADPSHSSNKICPKK